MLKREPLISVIVPIYKVEEYLNECINSVLNQSFNDYELILVDDGSPDKCPFICDEYAKENENIHVIHKTNGGLVSARKAGVNTAKGKYCFCLDGDDYIKPNTFEEISKIIHNYDVDVICYGFIYDYGDKTIINKMQIPEGYYDRGNIENAIFPFLIENKYGSYFSNSICGKVIKTDLYRKYQNLVDDDVKIGEDCACTKPIIFAAKSIYFLEEGLYYYRQNYDSMTKNKVPFRLDVPKLIAMHLEKNINMKYKEMQSQVYRYTTHLLFNSCFTQFYRKDKYCSIKKDIKVSLKDQYYNNAIRNCKYSINNVKGMLAKLCLKHRFYLLMKLYSIFK